MLFGDIYDALMPFIADPNSLVDILQEPLHTSFADILKCPFPQELKVIALDLL